MNSLDAGALHWLNQFAGARPAFDHVVAYVSDSDLFKGEALMFLLWWFWFAPSKPARANREIIVATVAAAAAAILLGRFLAHLLPFRPRPMSDPALGFVVPYAGLGNAKLRDWSSFPSDHAMLFAAMATGLLRISRRVGAAAWAYWIVVIGLPRAYLGLHYPTDLLAGGALGAALAWPAAGEAPRARIARLPLAWLDAHPASFYACFFIASFQIGTMFSEPRAILRGASLLLRRGS